MITMGRPRTRRKDLPTGLHQDKWGTYFYRGTKPDDRRYVVIGKVSREAAIKEWVALTTTKHDDAPAGTVAELIDRYLRDGMDDISAATKVNYEFHCGKLREQWGDRKYAITADQAARGGALRAMDIATYLRKAKVAGKGAVSASYGIGILSVIFSRAREWGLTEYNPCTGVRRTHAKKSTRLLKFEEIVKAAEAAGPRLALMIELGWRTGMRQTDIRNLQVQQIVGAEFHVKQSKTGMEQTWDITPEVRILLDKAAKLPGRSRSMFVFPMRNGKPVGVRGFQSEWKRLSPGFQFRAIRKWAINQKIKAGENATDFAGHFDPKTTRAHYDLTAKRLRPL